VSRYDYWQYWRQHRGRRRRSFLKLFTFCLCRDDARLAALKGKNQRSQEGAATEATALVHGREGASRRPDTDGGPSRKGALAETLPTFESRRRSSTPVSDVLAAYVEAGLVSSNGEARRQIKGGGLKVNGRPVVDEGYTHAAPSHAAGLSSSRWAKTATSC